MTSTSVVIPNWNGKQSLGDCLDSLKKQSYPAQIIVVDNGSTDSSADFIAENYPEAILIKLPKNKGFAGGVNAGIKKAMELGQKYVALLNNDAVVDKDWLNFLVAELDRQPKLGIATAKILDASKNHIDSTGDQYTVWGLPYPRGRGEPNHNQYDKDTTVFGASGGASLYRIRMLKEIGLFDEDFFAYYEDVDLSFRAQLAGWKITYVPNALVYHQIGATSSRIKDFATYHTLKNLPLLLWKNVPWTLMPKIWPRLALAYLGICGRALLRGQLSALLKGTFMGTVLLPKKWWQRRGIQKSRQVSIEYLDSIITHDLPPNAHNLRRLRASWWRLRGKRA